MQSLLKNLTIVSIIGLSSMVSAMDSDQKKQADQGALTQFEREQDSKRRSALTNMRPTDLELTPLLQEEEAQTEPKRAKNALKFKRNADTVSALAEGLQGTVIKGQWIDLRRLEKIPTDVQRYILLQYKRQQGAYFPDGHQLLPALVPCDCLNLFTPLKHKIAFSFEGGMITPTNYRLVSDTGKQVCSLLGNSGIIHRDQLTFSFIKTLPTCAISGKIINHRLYLDPCAEKEQLRSLDAKSIAYIRWLFNEVFSWPNPKPWQEIPIRISHDQEKIHDALPANIRANLEHNYNISRPKCCCCSAIYCDQWTACAIM